MNNQKIRMYNPGKIVNGEYVFENTSARPDNMVFTIRSTKTRRLYIHFDGSQVENTVIEKMENRF